MSSRLLQIGMVVTNTSFTADARWFADHQPAIIRLRDMSDLKRWILESGNWKFGSLTGHLSKRTVQPPDSAQLSVNVLIYSTFGSTVNLIMCTKRRRIPRLFSTVISC